MELFSFVPGLLCGADGLCFFQPMEAWPSGVDGWKGRKMRCSGGSVLSILGLTHKAFCFGLESLGARLTVFCLRSDFVSGAWSSDQRGGRWQACFVPLGEAQDWGVDDVLDVLAGLFTIKETFLALKNTGFSGMNTKTLCFPCFFWGLQVVDRFSREASKRSMHVFEATRSRGRAAGLVGPEKGGNKRMDFVLRSLDLFLWSGVVCIA